MNKRLLEEVSRQKELMNLNEQGLNFMSGVGDKLGSSLLKSLMKDTLGFESPDGEEDSKSEEPSSVSGGDTNFDNIVKNIIDKLEGGYFHPNMLKDGRVKDSRYGNSGETMFGIDRKNGGRINTSSAGREFWDIIDKENAKSNWKWNYKGGSLEPRLKLLVSKMMKPFYDEFAQKYLSPESREIVNKNSGLLSNFVYATWNGPGWFQKFAKKINDAVKSGTTNPKELGKISIDARKNSGNSLIAQGAKKVSDIMGSNYS
jgi:hypothetical protein